MAVIGCLGDIVFEVSPETVRTVSSMNWGGSARYGTHQRHGTYPLTEFSGMNPDTISFDITLLSAFGTDPMGDLSTLWTYMRNGKVLPLIIGEHDYGLWRWTITSLKIKIQNFDKAGNIISATVAVTLQEYLRK